MKTLATASFWALCCSLCLVLSATHAQSWDEYESIWPRDDKELLERSFVSGSFGAGFSSASTLVHLGPIIGYRLTGRWAAGPGMVYQYYRFRDPYAPADFRFNNWGYKAFTSYRINEFLMGYSEFERMRRGVVFQDNTGYHDMRVTTHALFVGGGYFQQIGRNSGLQIMLLYDLIDDFYSPYSNPDLRIGFVAGF